MVVMILIATMAFHVAVSPHGGVWQDDTPSHRAGEAVIATTHPKIYKHLMRANTATFVSSLITIFLVVMQPWFGKRILWLFSRYLMWVAIASTAVSYGGALLVSALNTQERSFTGIINFAVDVSLIVFGIMSLIWCLARIFGSRRIYDALLWPFGKMLKFHFDEVAVLVILECGSNLKPYVGKLFKSVEDGVSIYEEYANVRRQGENLSKEENAISSPEGSAYKVKICLTRKMQSLRQRVVPTSVEGILADVFAMRDLP
ncbi:hypothetical protein SASPL_104978 [Salvia splendens]|uniref:PGG domain-containing protein n=1 Tax=Salvia splendens TaxID=180675 RepID=A0A8X9A868_SALSN|nr:hypothetical protein SASPL_104978 [Salvia splendens]